MGLLDLTPECREAVDRWSGRVGAPHADNRKKVAIRVFQRDFVERFLATSHPALPGVWFGGFIVWGAFVGVRDHGWLGAGLLAAGVLGWTLLEYTLHRFVFHAVPGPSFGSKLRQFMLHGYHHEFPNDPWRLVAPPLMSWPIAAIVAAGLRLTLGPGLWWPAFSGVCAGYLAYDWTHFYTHHATPKWALGKFLRRIHAVHHFANPERNHGISSPLWDVAFGTYQSGQNAADGARRDTPA